MSQSYIFKHENGESKQILKSEVVWGSNIEWDTGDTTYKNSVGEMPLNLSCFIKSYQFNMGGWGWKLVEN